MQDSPIQPICPITLLPSLPQKKRYSKVNEALRVRFIEFIVQNNMSIKEASLTLNINYSSAKAILAHQRKTFAHSAKNNSKNSQRAQFRALSSLETYMDPIKQFVYSIGGHEVGRFASSRLKTIVKVPIIINNVNKEQQYQENTQNSPVQSS